MAKLAKVADRAKLKPRGAPYFERIADGRYIGFRKWESDSMGNWIARWRDPENSSQHHKALGQFADLPANERHDAAVKAAREWFEHLGLGGSTEVVTVRLACERYVDYLKREKTAASASETARRFGQYVFNQKIARIALEKLTPRHVEAWRHALEDLPTSRGTARTPSSLNRDMVCLKAALNFAKERGMIGTDQAWRTVLRPVEKADQRRDVYLDRVQRQALIEAAAPDLATFISALCALPFRPGAMAALTVADYDRRLHTLKVRTDKAHAGRVIKLPDSAAAMFTKAASGKTPNAHLFTRWDGSAWQKDNWKHAVRAAMNKAGLPAKATLYSLRHSTITDLVSAGVDMATVATLAGTSVLMIQKNYYHLQQNAAEKALAKLAL